MASRVLPGRYRRELMAVYGYARLTDEIGDAATGDRLQQLDWLESDLHRAAAGRASHPVLQSLSPLLMASDVALEQCRSLIEANRLDQHVKRYETFDDLVGYCMLSAAPVGRLVLTVFGATGSEQTALSDRVCIGLQVAEHLQDVGEDASAGRIYLPREDLDRFGCSEQDLLAASSSPALCRVVSYESERARGLLGAGVPLARTLHRREAAAVCGFVAGGLAALDAVDRAGGAVLETRCRPRRSVFARRAISAIVSANRRREVL
ncbi:MAG: squalene synthase HpnC [Acidimicrobiales bacterium]